MRNFVLFIIGLAGAQTVYAADARAYSEHVAATPTGTVQIDNVAGSVTVNGWDKPEVDIQGELGTSVERVEVTHTEDRIVIKVKLQENQFHMPDHSADATLQVHVPLNSTLEVSTVNAPITVDGVHKASRLHSVNADVHAGVAGADVEAASVNGNVHVAGNSDLASLRTSTVNGTVYLTHGTGEVNAHTVNGKLDLEVDGAKGVDVGSVSGEVAVRGRLLPDAHLKATAVNGHLSMKVHADAGYKYDISTFGGSIHTCFGEKDGSGPVKGQVGPGGAGQGSIHLSTLHGDIDLCDK